MIASIKNSFKCYNLWMFFLKALYLGFTNYNPKDSNK